MEPEEVSEILSQDTEVEYDFLPKEEEASGEEAPAQEEITIGETKVIFREPTEQELPIERVPREDGGFIGQDFFTEDQEWKKTTIGKTPGGMEIAVIKRRDGVGYELSSGVNGGRLPSRLEGWFTTYDKAEVAARTYLHELWDQKG
jgi:hypothetical protein